MDPTSYGLQQRMHLQVQPQRLWSVDLPRRLDVSQCYSFPLLSLLLVLPLAALLKT